jgi:hypothetical protein
MLFSISLNEYDYFKWIVIARFIYNLVVNFDIFSTKAAAKIKHARLRKHYSIKVMILIQ